MDKKQDGQRIFGRYGYDKLEDGSYTLAPGLTDQFDDLLNRDMALERLAAQWQAEAVEGLRERVAKSEIGPIATVYDVATILGLPLSSLAYAASHAEEIRMLSAGELVTAKRELINRPRQHHSGLRAAVTWLHNRAKTMNDPHAKAILDAAAYNLGNDIPHIVLPETTSGGKEQGGG